ncbi:MAG: hypothetical protein ACRCTA_01105, partial [Bacilli bacterium]
NDVVVVVEDISKESVLLTINSNNGTYIVIKFSSYIMHNYEHWFGNDKTIYFDTISDKKIECGPKANGEECLVKEIAGEDCFTEIFNNGVTLNSEHVSYAGYTYCPQQKILNNIDLEKYQNPEKYMSTYKDNYKLFSSKVEPIEWKDDFQYKQAYYYVVDSFLELDFPDSFKYN